MVAAREVKLGGKVGWEVIYGIQGSFIIRLSDLVLVLC